MVRWLQPGSVVESRIMRIGMAAEERTTIKVWLMSNSRTTSARSVDDATNLE